MTLKTKAWWVILCWLLLVGAAFARDHFLEYGSRSISPSRRRGLLRQIVLTRSWNSGHGGVYVPVTGKTLPNPFLEDPLRGLETTAGVRLTKINPAFMTRQIAEIASRESGIQFHITSLRPIRPDNASPSATPPRRARWSSGSMPSST